MVVYLKEHEARMTAALEAASAELDWAGLARCHRRRMANLQHERIVHLLVMLFVGLFCLLSFLSFIAQPGLGLGALVFAFLSLLVPYIAHYFRLENGVQRLYLLADRIELRAGEIPGC